jgi:acetyltransferase-like isoleucine patch superfamily enzyme
MDNPSERINTIDLSREVIIENNVWIGSGCTILPGTKIGEGSVIAANSVVRGTVPKNCIFGGNPGKLIKQY